MAETPYERPERLMQHVSSDDLGISIGPLAAALATTAIVLLAAGVLVVAFAF